MKKSIKTIAWFEEITRNDIGIAGGKGANQAVGDARAEEVLDLAEGMQFDASLLDQPAVGRANQRVGRFGEWRTLPVEMAAQDGHRGLGRERIDERRREAGAEHHVGRRHRDAHRAEQARPVRPLAERQDLAQVLLVARLSGVCGSAFGSSLACGRKSSISGSATGSSDSATANVCPSGA